MAQLQPESGQSPLMQTTQITATGYLGIPRSWVSLFGFLICLILCVAFVAVIISNDGARWPFRRGKGIVETYQNIVIYLPILVFSVASMVWLKVGGVPVRRFFSVERFFSVLIMSVALFSAGYSVWLLASCRFEMVGFAYWPLVCILSLMNAVAEEIVYRLVCFQLVKQVLRSPVLCNIIQSLIYASVHIPIGGVRFAGMVFWYGLFLGLIVEKHRSVLPAIVCHFLIDIGIIGLPLLVEIS